MLSSLVRRGSTCSILMCMATRLTRGQLRRIIREALDLDVVNDVVRRYGERFGYEYRPGRGLVSPLSWRMTIESDGTIVGYGYDPYPDTMKLTVRDLEDAINNGTDYVRETDAIRGAHATRRQGQIPDDEWDEMMGGAAAPIDDVVAGRFAKPSRAPSGKGRKALSN